jgi:hypothetical protein
MEVEDGCYMGAGEPLNSMMRSRQYLLRPRRFRFSPPKAAISPSFRCEAQRHYGIGAYPSVPLPLGNGLSLEGYDLDKFGFLRLEVSKAQIVGTYCRPQIRAARPRLPPSPRPRRGSGHEYGLQAIGPVPASPRTHDVATLYSRRRRARSRRWTAGCVRSPRRGQVPGSTVPLLLAPLIVWHRDARAARPRVPRAVSPRIGEGIHATTTGAGPFRPQLPTCRRGPAPL